MKNGRRSGHDPKPNHMHSHCGWGMNAVSWSEKQILCRGFRVWRLGQLIVLHREPQTLQKNNRAISCGLPLLKCWHTPVSGNNPGW